MVSPTMTNFPAGVAIWGPPYGGTDGVPLLPSGPISYFGKNVWFVDTVNGSDGYSGTSPSQAFMSDNTSTYNLTSGGNNTVKFNSFPNVAADIDPAHGYDGNATDTWTSNSAQDAVVFGDPA